MKTIFFILAVVCVGCADDKRSAVTVPSDPSSKEVMERVLSDKELAAYARGRADGYRLAVNDWHDMKTYDFKPSLYLDVFGSRQRDLDSLVLVFKVK